MGGDGILVPLGIPCHCHLPTPHHLLPRHLCPPTPWAAARESAATVTDRGKTPLLPAGQRRRAHIPNHTVPAVSHRAPGSQAGAEPSAGLVCCPLRRVRAVGEPGARSRGAARAAWEVGHGARGGGAALPAPAPPSAEGERAFQAAALAPPEPAARECVAKAMGTILLILLAIVLLPALRCPGGERRRRRRQPAWDEGCLRGGEDAPHDPPPPPKPPARCGGTGTRWGQDADGERRCWRSLERQVEANGSRCDPAASAGGKVSAGGLGAFVPSSARTCPGPQCPLDPKGNVPSPGSDPIEGTRGCNPTPVPHSE